MADPNNKLPEGTDAIIGGAGSGGSSGGTGRSDTAGSAATTSTQTNATGGQTRTTDSSDPADALLTGGGTSAGAAGNSALGSSGTTGSAAGTGGASGASSTGGTGSDSGGGSSNRSGVRGLISNAGGKLRDEGKNRVQSLASQGLERGSTALTNIAGIVDDTVQQIEERLGPQYGEYARKASQALNGYASTLQNKNPDELVEDARGLVRKSPTVALTGAAVLGFGLVRLLKVGLEEAQNGTGNRNNDRTGTAG